MSDVSPAKQAQHVVDGHAGAIAFLNALRTSTPTGNELATLANTHTHPLSEESRLFMRGFLRQVQKFLEQAAQQKGFRL
jgi:predicted metal-dependent hydrolase